MDKLASKYCPQVDTQRLHKIYHIKSHHAVRGNNNKQHSKFFICSVVRFEQNVGKTSPKELNPQSALPTERYARMEPVIAFSRTPAWKTHQALRRLLATVRQTVMSSPPSGILRQTKFNNARVTPIYAPNGSTILPRTYCWNPL